MFFSCSNSNLEEIKDLIKEGEVPTEKFENISIYFTDSAKLQARIFGTIMNRFTADSAGRIEIKDSLLIFFYDSTENIESKLTSKYGYYNENDKVIELLHNVQFENYKEEQTLETEKLTWDQDNGKVFTPKDQYVSVKQKDAIINGFGLTANDRFSSYKMYNITGIVPLEIEDSTKQNEKN